MKEMCETNQYFIHIYLMSYAYSFLSIKSHKPSNSINKFIPHNVLIPHSFQSKIFSSFIESASTHMNKCNIIKIAGLLLHSPVK